MSIEISSGCIKLDVISQEEDKARGNCTGCYLSRFRGTRNAAAAMIPVKGMLVGMPGRIKRAEKHAHALNTNALHCLVEPCEKFAPIRELYAKNFDTHPHFKKEKD
jgi:hypothetical protein